jgi:hypothetical protein
MPETEQDKQGGSVVTLQQIRRIKDPIQRARACDEESRRVTRQLRAERASAIVELKRKAGTWAAAAAQYGVSYQRLQAMVATAAAEQAVFEAEQAEQAEAG